jgi:deoxycitidine kinase
MLIYIEGNIGTGKSTFVEKLSSYMPRLKELQVDPKLILEPVDEWLETKDSDGKHILQKFYGDQTKWAFTFQMNSFISRVKRIQDELFKDDNGQEKIAFVERSIYTDKNCFAKLCHESGKMTTLEYEIYCNWNEWLSEQFNVRPDVYIYLRCLPSVNDTRIKERARSSEDNIPLEYLEALHEKHDLWLEEEQINGVPVYVIDANRNFKDVLEMDKIFEELYNFLKTFLHRKNK